MAEEPPKSVLDLHRYVAGNPAEWDLFLARHEPFIACLPELHSLARGILEREFTGGSKASFVVYGLGLLCWEDFDEICILAGNGQGFGAQKLLRGMYERTVTAAYIHEHPDEAQRFMDFEDLRNYKVARELFQGFGADAVSEEQLSAFKAARDEMQSQFTRTCHCQKSCTARLESISWNNLDVISMASKLKTFDLRQGAAAAYYIPMPETHASFHAIAARQVPTHDGSSYRQRQAFARDVASQVTVQAHNLVLVGLQIVFNEFAELQDELRDLMNRCDVSYREAWASPPPDVIGDE
jgi:hypothetical protein